MPISICDIEEERGWKPKDGEAYVSVQWGGTDACLNLNCECGANAHFDGYFASFLQCVKCGAVYMNPFHSRLVKLTLDERKQLEHGGWPCTVLPVDEELDL